MPSFTQPQRRAIFFTIFSVFVTLWLASPFISSGLPYFYNEDEAHHYNRVVNMVKSGSYNPKYFHKPSLHFYLRMPIVAGSFLWSVKKGYLRKLDDIETFNPYGLGDYSFTASHPGMVKWNRGFSLLLSLGLVVGACGGAFLLSGSSTRMIGVAVAGLITAVSPSLISESTKIGVDQLFSLLCIIASLLAVASFQNKKFLTWSAIAAGLAVSSKYNALPIVLIPACTSLLLDQGIVRSVMLLLLSGVCFVAGSPYILIELPLFLNQIAYEIWHYGIAGHQGHEGTPGLPQAIHYGTWLLKEALNVPAFLISLFGLFVSIKHKRTFIFLLFPMLFFLLMINQKANFERNMTVIIPYLAVCAALGFETLLGFFKSANAAKIVSVAGLFVLIILPATESWIRGVQASEILESRTLAEPEIRTLLEKGNSIAIAGELLFPPSLYEIPFAKKFSQEKDDLLELANQGFQYVVVRNPVVGITQSGIYSSFEQFAGSLGKQRVVQNPSIGIYQIQNTANLKTLIMNKPLIVFNETTPGVFIPVSTSFGESYIWAQHLINVIQGVQCRNKKGCMATMKVSTPWSGQKISLDSNPEQLFEISETSPTDISFTIPFGAPSIILSVKEVSSPASNGMSEDSRRLGVALHEIRIKEL